MVLEKKLIKKVVPNIFIIFIIKGKEALLHGKIKMLNI